MRNDFVLRYLLALEDLSQMKTVDHFAYSALKGQLWVVSSSWPVWILQVGGSAMFTEPTARTAT